MTLVFYIIFYISGIQRRISNIKGIAIIYFFLGNIVTDLFFLLFKCLHSDILNSWGYKRSVCSKFYFSSFLFKMQRIIEFFYALFVFFFPNIKICWYCISSIMLKQWERLENKDIWEGASLFYCFGGSKNSHWRI